jgi:4-carboxymuconolactone decarboxylase
VLDPVTRHLCICATVASCNRAEALRAALHQAIEGGVAPPALYEIILQSYLFAGFPAALEGLRALLEMTTELGIEWTPPDAEPIDTELFAERGTRLYRQIYNTNHEKLRTAVERFSPDMFQYMIVEGYGKVLSRPGVTGIQRELATVTALVALGWDRQVVSHVRGAINLGATAVEVFAAIELAEPFCSRDHVSRMMSAVAPHLPSDLG